MWLLVIYECLACSGCLWHAENLSLVVFCLIVFWYFWFQLYSPAGKRQRVHAMYCMQCIVDKIKKSLDCNLEPAGRLITMNEKTADVKLIQTHQTETLSLLGGIRKGDWEFHIKFPTLLETKRGTNRQLAWSAESGKSKNRCTIKRISCCQSVFWWWGN